jgi:GntR family transcriptional regulator/MocR family aminotransferase
LTTLPNSPHAATTFTLNAGLALEIGTGRGISHRLYRALRQAVVDGRLRAGEKLPSTRDLAASLAVSRNTVSEVYERLGREGHLEGRHGSGTFVAAHGAPGDGNDEQSATVSPPAISDWARRLSRSRSVVPHREMVHDFRPGLPDLESFPVDIWRRLAARNLRVLSSAVGAYGDAAGQLRLRAAIARYLAHSRAVVCHGDDVFICNGSQQALDLLGRILVQPGTRVAIENPGYTPAVSIFRAMGATMVPVPVDDEGLVVGRLPRSAKVVYVTPSHQFPLGVTLSLARRKALLDWAHRSGAVIIEDDYDSEFRFGGRPMESLQGLDRSGVVVYLGTFSKVLFPGLRLGYVVAPQWLQEPFMAAKWITDRHASALEQSVMADFIADGHFGRHLRRMQRVYRERRQALVDALAQWTSGHLALLPSLAGLHVAGFLPRGFDAEELVQRAYEAGVGLYSIAPFYVGRPRPGLIFGYAGCTIMEIEEGARRLGGILRSMSAPPRARSSSVPVKGATK